MPIATFSSCDRNRHNGSYYLKDKYIGANEIVKMAFFDEIRKTECFCFFLICLFRFCTVCTLYTIWCNQILEE